MSADAEFDHAPTPGETLRRVLDRNGMSQRELATRTGLTPKHVNQMLQGIVTLSPDVADRLELATGVRAELWNRLEADHRTVQARLSQARDLAADLDWVSQMPVAAMVKQGLLPAEPKDAVSRARQLLAFFGVASPAVWRDIWLRPNAAFRQSAAFQAHPGAVAAWLREGERRAHEVDCAPIDLDEVELLLPRLRALSREEPAVFGVEVRELLSSAGVAVVYLKEVVGARVNGATIWLSPVKAAIILSLRHKTDDVFFFTLFHELGHLLRHSRRATFVSDENSGDQIEREADVFAANHLIPPERQSELIDLSTLIDVDTFARDIGVCPGVVVGQLHHQKLWPWSKGAKLKRSLRIVNQD